MKEECEKAEPENILVRSDGQVTPREESIPPLREKHFGDGENHLSPVESLYLLERRNFRLLDSGTDVEFGDLLLEEVRHDPRILSRYIVYRDWRDRGVFPFELERAPENAPDERSMPTKYPTKPLKLPSIESSRCYFFREAEMSMIFQKNLAERLYYDTWIGQLGKYKQEKAGTNLSIDLIETLYLMSHEEVDLEVIDAATGDAMTRGDLLAFAQERHPGIEDLMAVYEDWRRSGYIVKTGFKFGAHFRIYFPGAGTGKNKWIHSKHVLHVIPKSYRMLMSEWGRIIRLSQSVKKTFILGVPALSGGDYDDRERGDLILFHRTKDGIQNPNSDRPTFLCVAIPETLRMSGLEFANALREAEEKGLQLLIAVVDRETDINYYVARKILLEGSDNSYYEIYWYRP